MTQWSALLLVNRERWWFCKPSKCR